MLGSLREIDAMARTIATMAAVSLTTVLTSLKINRSAISDSTAAITLRSSHVCSSVSGIHTEKTAVRTAVAGMLFVYTARYSLQKPSSAARSPCAKWYAMYVIT